MIAKLPCFVKLMTKSHLIFQGTQVSLNTVQPSLQNHDRGKVLLVGDLFNTEQKAWFLCDPQLKMIREEAILNYLKGKMYSK